MAKEQQEPEPAAQTNLGPAPHSGGEKDFSGAVVPPYDGREKEMRSDYDEGMAHVFNADAAKVGPGREISETERQGSSPTGTDADSPLGVGVSMTPQGNEQALGGESGGEGRKGDENDEARRKDREEAGIAPQPPIDPSMPNLRPGDQGG